MTVSLSIYLEVIADEAMTEDGADKNNLFGDAEGGLRVIIVRMQ